MSENKTTTVPNLDSAADFDGKSGQALTGAWEGPQWAPHLNPEVSDLKDSVLKAKLGKMNPGSTARRSLRGIVQVVRAYGHAAYALDVKTPDGIVRVLLPEHGAVYAALNLTTPGKSEVGLLYEGKLPIKGKPGKSAHTYRIATLSGPANLTEPRADALRIVSSEEREAKKAARDAADLDAARAAAREEADDAGDVGDASDLPI